MVLRRLPAPAALTIVLLLLLAAALVVGRPAGASGLIEDWPLRAVEALLVVVGVAGLREHLRAATNRRERSGWLLLGLGGTAAAVSLVLLMVDPGTAVRVGGPLAANLPSMLAAPLAALGALLLARPVRGPAQAVRLLLDAVGIGASTAVFAWYLALRPLGAADAVGAVSPSVTMAYLVLDATALALGLLALLRAPVGLRANVGVGVGALALLLLADSSRGFELVPGATASVTLGELSWVGALALMATAAWIRPSAPRSAPVSDPERAAPLWWVALPYLFMVPVSGVLLVSAIRDDVDVPMVIGAAVIIAVLGFRHVLALYENAGLTGRLSSSVRQLEYRTTHDELTGLLNRTGLIERLDELRRQHDDGTGRPAVLLFIDIDRFKSINDTLGHTIGDAVLRAVAERLRGAIRTSDGFAARFAGDEFVLLFPGLGSEPEALTRAQDALDLVERPIPLVDGGEIIVTASAGVAIADRVSDGEAIVREADLAMFEAKERGRARIHVFEEGLRQRSESRVQIEQDMRRSLADPSAFEVHMQPLVRLDDEALWGAEALVRWRHPSSGLLLPGRFLSVAEDSGMIVPLGGFVLAEACAAAAAVPGITVSVNLSHRQLHDPFLVPTIVSHLEAHGLDPDRLCLEVTEEVLVDDRTIGVLERLQRVGTRVAIDDFGVGASSLRQLRRIPGAQVKIDRSFIENIDGERGGDDRVMVKALVAVAEQLGLAVVAEGIERQAQLDAVRELGIRIGQGWFLGVPQRVAAFVTSRGGRPLVRRGPHRA